MRAGLKTDDSDESGHLHAGHDDVAQLLRVVESQLALMGDGEPFDSAVMLDALDDLIDLVQDLHGRRDADVVATLSARHHAIQTAGAELYHRLDLATRDDTMNRAEIIRLGYEYCGELRRLLSVEARALHEASLWMSGVRDELS